MSGICGVIPQTQLGSHDTMLSLGGEQLLHKLERQWVPAQLGNPERPPCPVQSGTQAKQVGQTPVLPGANGIMSCQDNQWRLYQVV